MSEQELQQIWKFTRNIRSYSNKTINKKFELRVSLNKGRRLLFQSDREIMTYKERMFLVFSYPGSRNCKSGRKLITKFDCGWDITDLDDDLINELEESDYDTTNLKETYKEVQRHPEYKKAKREAKKDAA
jgi:hypothetical protein